MRLLRAVRLATKLGFEISKDAEEQIAKLAPLLHDIPPARLFEECLKLLLGGCALQTFEQLRHYQLFGTLFPQTEAALSQQRGGYPHTLIINALQNTDRRLAENKTVTPGFLLAALLWSPMDTLAQDYMAQGQRKADAMMLAADVVISKQTSSTSIPRRFTNMARGYMAITTQANPLRPPPPTQIVTTSAL